MPKGKIILATAIMLFCVSNKVLNAQSNNHTITSYQAREALDKIYGLDQRLVSGRSYPGQAKGSIVGHPYWIDSGWKIGRVTINGIDFSNLLLKFDILEGDLILNTLNLNNQVIQVRLNIKDISEFRIGDKRFILFPGDNNSRKPKFCEVRTEGTLSYLVARSKSLVVASGSSMDFTYQENVENYLLFEGRIIDFKNKQTLYKLFPDQKQELKRFIRQNAVLINRRNTVNRAIMVAYCNSLIDLS